MRRSDAHGTNQPGQDSTPEGPPARAWSLALVITISCGITAILCSVGLILVAGLGLFGLPENDTLESAGWIGLFASLALVPAAIVTVHRLPAAGTRDALAEQMGRLEETLRHLSNQSSLSGDARRVLNRKNERSLLCKAIEEDIVSEEWDAAIVLCKELADRFGFRTEAEQFRQRIEQSRAVVQERRLNDAIAGLDGLIVQRQWDKALHEAARIKRLFPESHRVTTLRRRVEQARAVYKVDLERRFLEAAERGGADEAMMLLKELDSYLTEAQAEPYREMARGVISKARENLGAQFKIAVQDRKWPVAAAIGKRIINEFPNTRMAQEVRGLLDIILARANSD